MMMELQRDFSFTCYRRGISKCYDERNICTVGFLRAPRGGGEGRGYLNGGGDGAGILEDS